jgi:hypothetical protein
MSVSNPEAKIANGTSLSGVVVLRDYLLAAIIIPASWTAANLTFQAAEKEDGTFSDVYDSAGVEKVVTAAAGHAIILNPADFAGFGFIKIRSGASAAPVNQGADRNLKLVVRH